MSACFDSMHVPKSASLGRRFLEIAAWVLPSALLALMPKCPACVAAYIAVWTGLGLSLTTASYVRATLLVLCVASLSYLVATRLGRFLGFGRVSGGVIQRK
jgi:hypothetical protein